MGNHQDVAKKYGGVHIEAPERLQGRFHGKGRRIAKLQKIRRLFPKRAVLGQIPSRLAHEPERRRCYGFPVQDAQQDIF